MTKGQIVWPPIYPKMEGPSIFLAGPIQGARDWQKEAIAYFQKHAPSLHITSPRRNKALEAGFVYAEQVDWESFYLNRAAENGCILFFLAKEQTSKPGRAYAQTSRFELGEWKARQLSTGCNLVIGIEEGFSGARYIRHRVGKENPNVPILTTLTETCQKAIDLLFSQKLFKNEEENDL